MAERKSVKNVKLKTKPSTTPTGRFLLPVTELERIIGSNGRMHGERIVTTPAKNANPARRIIVELLNPRFQLADAAAVPLGDFVAVGIDLHESVLVSDAILPFQFCLVVIISFDYDHI